MGGRAAFKKGQKCLIPHIDRHYAAQILKAQKRDDQHHYLVHYLGWGKKYDEWVEESGLVKYDESLLPPEERAGGSASVAAIARGEGSDVGEGRVAAGGAAPGSGGGAGAASRQAGGGGGGGGGERSTKKRKTEAAVAETPALDEKSLPLQLRLHIPPLLKKAILDDHDQVTHQYRLQPLPRRPCVREILCAFEQARRQEGGGSADAATLEVVNGLQNYFDQGLRQLLLYQQEVQQYDEFVPSGKSPCDVYGGEHLVRLLVKLPELVPVATMGAQNVVTLEGRLHELMSLLVDKQAQYFLPASAYVQNPHVTPPLPLPPLPTAPAPPAAPPPAAVAPAVPQPTPVAG